MKQVLCTLLVLCLLLCGCQAAAPAETGDSPFRGAVDKLSGITTQTEPPPTQTTTAPTTQPLSETVTVYLIEKTETYDDGPTFYYYDDHYNILRRELYTMENQLRYIEYFEDPDENGMPRQDHIYWPDGSDTVTTLSYFQDGKLKEAAEAGSLFCGVRYFYDLKGDLCRMERYYDDELQTTVHLEYDGETLINVFCEDTLGETIYSCRVENSHVVEKTHPSPGMTYILGYTYDENGNLASSTFTMESETQPDTIYYYRAVEVPFERAGCIRSQQSYLLSIY